MTLYQGARVKQGISCLSHNSLIMPRDPGKAALQANDIHNATPHTPCNRNITVKEDCRTLPLRFYLQYEPY
jgi:hypothetical protein